MTRPRYVLITPARNEEKYIEQTIQSVIAQTIPPVMWVIVSDGSTDQTDAIVQKYCTRHSFMQLVTCQGDARRNFGSKVQAFYAGYALVAQCAYDFIGNLDADVTFVPEYFETIIDRFNRNASLGIAGGIITERIAGQYIPQTIHANSVAGAVQLFRRNCFEQIAGYRKLEYGGIDAAAEIMARMHGWGVQTFPEMPVKHHRRVAIRKGNFFRARYRQGIMYYKLGYHPLFHALRCLKKMCERPYVIGGLCVGIGYFAFFCRKKSIGLPGEVVDFLRNEQCGRMKARLTR